MKTSNKISLLCRYTVFEGETRAQKHDYFADNSIMYWISFLFFKDTEKGWLCFLIMLTKCGNPLIWDAHLLKEVMKSNHFLVESIERKPNQSLLVATLIFPKLWSPHGLWLPKESSVNTWGTRQLEGTKGTHTISLRNTHISAKLPPPILWSLYAPNSNRKPNPNNFS